MALLTVAVPTIPGRESLLSRCLWHLTEQATDDVEILVIDGPGLQGDKATLAAQLATGDYMTLVDDDDHVAADYVAAVLPELRANVDYVGFRILQIIDGRYYGQARNTGDHRDFGRRMTGPTPKGIARTSIWRTIGMGNHYTADRDWMAAALPLVSTWSFVDRALYIYDHHPRVSAYAGNGERRDVGMWPFDESRIRRASLAPT